MRASHARVKRPPVRRALVCRAFTASSRRFQTYHFGTSRGKHGPCQHIEVQPDGADAWRLDEVADMVHHGAIGIIPTDSYPALVCDLGSSDATRLLADVKHVSVKKPMSILARNFRDVDEYTLGWPAASIPGQPDVFGVVRKLVPGPYTFILPASKALPKVVVNSAKHKRKQRHTVGVRMPADPVCQALLSKLDRPLLCTSVHVSEEDGMEIPDSATMMDMYPDIDFVVDAGYVRVAEPSTVVDMTSQVPEVLRVGKGDPEPFDPYHIFLS
eukprot:TRINITY_DN3064_c0_g1_i2.p1 TRINITY_DN3064_c0_g1~~TRINITY_DN3064_c0_g1_i2.p1  ORF type:complete len:271 (+),score=26.82 TRINITY_DN3064_c0_g1_i2:203-1015(+)